MSYNTARVTIPFFMGITEFFSPIRKMCRGPGAGCCTPEVCAGRNSLTNAERVYEVELPSAAMRKTESPAESILAREF